MAAPTVPIMGANGKLYRNTGSYGSPTWNLISNVRDIEPNWEFGDADVSSRAGGGFRWHEPTLVDIAFSATMLYDPADDDYVAFLAAAQARTAIDIFVLDQAQATAGSQGPRGIFKIFKFGRKEGLDGMMEVNIDFKLAYSANPPTWSTTS